MFVLFAPFRDVPSGGYRIPRLHRGLFTIEPFGSTPSLYGSYSGFKTQNFLNPVVFPVSAVAIIFGCGTYFKPLRQPLLLSAAATGNRQAVFKEKTYAFYLESLRLYSIPCAALQYTVVGDTLQAASQHYIGKKLRQQYQTASTTVPNDQHSSAATCKTGQNHP